MYSIDGVKLGDSLESIQAKNWVSLENELKSLIARDGWESLGEYYATKIQREGWEETANIYTRDWENFEQNSQVEIRDGCVRRVTGLKFEKNGVLLFQSGDSWEVPFKKLKLSALPDAVAEGLSLHEEPELGLSILFQDGQVQEASLLQPGSSETVDAQLPGRSGWVNR